MRIWDIRINGMTNPVGFDFNTLTLSYLAQDVPDTLSVIIYKEGKLVYSQPLELTQSFGTELVFQPEKESRYRLVIHCGSYASDPAYFETGTNFDARFITPCEPLTAPVLLRRFACGEKLRSARLYITGVGLYEAYLNGKKVGNEYLTPYCTDYNSCLQYQTFDVTDALQQENCLEIMLGDGWYKGRFGLKHRENIYGSEYAAAAKLVMRYSDGSCCVLTTDESWLARPSHVTFNNIYDGETQDDTRDTSQTCACRFCEKTFPVKERRSLPVVVHETLTPTLIRSPKGEQILDFGQNFSGFVSFSVPLQKGQTVRLTAGEVLQKGCFYRENLRTAKATFCYTSDGVRKTVAPHFTFYGFRYMLVEGMNRVDPADFTGNVIYSALRQTACIQTGNPKMDRLLQNCLWGQKSNFLDVPTDCPQRDERLGWTGDAQVFSRTACYQMDCRAFYDKYLMDIASDQAQRNGALPVYSPSFGDAENAYSVWGDAATIIPWNLYLFYGDKSLLRKHFPIMESYVQSIYRQDKNRLYDFGFHLGDWLSQDGNSPSALKGATDEYLIASVYYYNSAKLTAQAAQALTMPEKEHFYSELAQQIRQAILNEYFTPSGRLAVDTQTAYTICITFDLYKEKQKLLDGFRARLVKDCYKIKGGFVGATQLIQALIKMDMTEEAFRILYAEAFPSWLYCVNLGATTIWERWNSLSPDGSISGTEMNSMNHYSFGAVAESFYGYIAGLQPVKPAFKQAVIEPKFNYRLQKLEFAFDSASGRYVVNYSAQGNTILLHVEIPFGASAELILPDLRKMLDAGSYDFTFPSPVEMEHPFSIEMPMCELFANEKSAALLKAIAPTAYQFLTTSDLGVNGMPLRALAGIDAFAAMGSKMELIDKKLRAL